MESIDSILTCFNSITSSILNEEIGCEEGIIRYREFLDVVTTQNSKMSDNTRQILTATEQLSFRHARMTDIQIQMDQYEEYKIVEEVQPSISTLEVVKLEPIIDKENVAPNSEAVKESCQLKQRLKKKEWQRPFMELVDRDTFDSFGRHDKGRLKYEQLVDAINQINCGFQKKYELLSQYKAKMKLSHLKSEAQRYFDEDLATPPFNISEGDFSKCSFNKLGHSKTLIINILKNQGRLGEKRRGKERVYSLVNPQIENLPLTKPTLKH